MNGVRGRKIFINKPYFSSQSLSPLSLTPLWLGLRGCFHWCLHAPFASLSKPLLSEFLFHFMKLSWTLPFYLTYEALFINQGILHMYCEPEVFNLFFWHLILIFYPFPPPLIPFKSLFPLSLDWSGFPCFIFFSETWRFYISFYVLYLYY